MKPRPQIILNWEEMFCPDHIEPLREAWPSGAAMAILGLFNAACEDEKIFSLCEEKMENMAGVIKAIKPVCCYLPYGVAEQAINLALDGKVYGQKEEE